MPICTHKGCEKQYEEAENNDQACLYHPGPPIFHEGLKGWQCCTRRVVSFDDFLTIPGCTSGRHTDEVQQQATVNTAPKEGSTKSPEITREGGVEVYNTGPSIPFVNAQAAASSSSGGNQNDIATTRVVETKPTAVDQPPLLPEEDDPSILVPSGTKCKRNGCEKTFIDDATSRGEGEEAECVYHPGQPIFHEGSKGWSCCSRKVLEFEEFLKIRGCKTGNHLFVGSGNDTKTKKEEIVQCRHDWYQTPTTVIMSVFAKKVDKEKSTISFKEQELAVDLRMPDGKRFQQVYSLYQLIDPKNSSFEVLGTKVEIKLKKANGISWPSLRSDEVNTIGVTTFGITGGSATVGGKEYSLATDSPLYTDRQQ